MQRKREIFVKSLTRSGPFEDKLDRIRSNLLFNNGVLCNSKRPWIFVVRSPFDV